MRLHEVRPRPLTKKQSQERSQALNDLLQKLHTGELHPDDIPNDHVHKELVTAMHQHGIFPAHQPTQMPTSVASSVDPQKLFRGMVVDTKKLKELLASDVQLRHRLEDRGIISYQRK
jgi:hypothetical protein